MPLRIDPATASDWPAIKRIYEEGISTGNTTFDPSPPETFDDWINCRIANCSLVARSGDDVVGWVSLSRVSDRTVYAGVAFLNVYVGANHRGMGIGSLLISSVIERSEAEGIWMLEARIFPENVTSIHLHKKYGFREVGTRKKVGRMEYGPYAGIWRDVLILERRSRKAGKS